MLTRCLRKLLPLIAVALAAVACASTADDQPAPNGVVDTVEETTPEDRRQEAVDLLLAAIETYRAGNEDEALRQFEQAADAHPGFIDPLLAMGDLHERRGDWEAARTQYRRALEVDPTLTVVGVRIGLTYVAEGRLDDAHAWLVRCIEADPGSFQALYNLGTLCLQRAEASEENGHTIAAEEARREALGWYELAAVIETRDLDAPARIARLRLRFGDPQGALEAAELALDRAEDQRGGLGRPGARAAAEVIVLARRELEAERTDD